MRISVVVPIYNIKPYLRQCIDSIGALGNNDYEIILVNDGSTDDSEAICKDYASKWDNVKLLEKTNGGLSDARNCGTEIARGDYIYYLDSDDWIASGAIERLYLFAVDHDCDVVQGGFYYTFEDHLEYDNRWFKMDDEPFILDREKAMLELIKNNYIKNFAWGKLYKASIVKRHLFPVGKYYEDSYWQHLVINDCRHYGVIPEPLYYYRQRKGSISGTSSVRLLDLIEGQERRLGFIIQSYPEYTCEMADRLWKSSFSMRNINDDFNLVFKRIDDQYRCLLSSQFKDSLYYKLASSGSKWFRIYCFYLRVNGRIFGKKLQRIELY